MHLTRGAAALGALGLSKGGGAELLEAIAAAQEEAGSYEFTLDLDVEGEQVTGSGAATAGAQPSDVALTLTMDVAGSELTMLMADGQMYMSLPAAAGLPTDATWLSLDPDGDDPLSQQFGQMLAEVGSSASVDEQLLTHAEVISVEEVGPDAIDGVDTTEYLLTIDADDVGDVIDVPEGDEVPFDELTYSLWVDDDHLPRQLISDLGGVGAMQMRFENFGTDVEIEPPPEGDVTDFGTILDELIRELEELTDVEGFSEDELDDLLEELEDALLDTP